MATRREIDEAVIDIALSRYGVITTADALSAGMTQSAVHRRVKNGLWIPIYPATYRLREVLPTWEQSLAAACAWAGEDAVASHRAAAQLLGLGVENAPIEIYAPTRRKKPAGIQVHHTDLLERCDVTRVDGIPVTTASRTLIDLGAVAHRFQVESGLEAAFRSGASSPWYLVDRLDAVGKPGRRGTATLRSLLRERDPRLAPTESELETRLWQIIDRSGLPLPERQFQIWDTDGPIGRVDFAYPRERWVIEAQSAAWHLAKSVQVKDIERRRRLTLIGWRVLEVHWQDVVRRQRVVADLIRRALFDLSAA